MTQIKKCWLSNIIQWNDVGGILWENGLYMYKKKDIAKMWNGKQSGSEKIISS